MKTLILSVIAAGTLFITACSSNSTSDKTQTSDSTSVHSASTYTCSMHPEVLSDKPGKCPKCKMDLVVKEGAEDHMGHQH